MKTKFIKVNGITDVTTLVQKASVVDGDIVLRKGKFAVDGKSLMGCFSLDLSTGAVVEYPEIATDFEDFISLFEVKAI